MDADRPPSLWAIARERLVTALWRWVARRVQPHLEPTTSIRDVQVWNNGQAPAFQIGDDGVRLGRGAHLRGQ